MLILTRSLGQSLLIGEEIVIRYIGLQGRQIRLGIDAPMSVKVLRQEMLDKMLAGEWVASKK